VEALRRDTGSGLIAGVAAGIARRMDLGPWLVRFAFIFATIFGGVGAVLYIAAWLLIPADGEDQSIVENWLSGNDDRNSWAGAALIGIAILILIASINAVDGAVAVAAALFVVGVLLYRGTFDQRLERHPGGADTTAAEPAPAAHPASKPMAATTFTGQDAAIPASDDDARAPAPPPPSELPAMSPAAPMPAPRRRERSRLGPATIALVLIVLGAVGMVDTIGGVAVSATHYLGAAVIVVGLGLLVGSFWGRSRLLILLGIVMFTILQVGAWFDVPLTGGFGDPRFHPTSVATVRPEYRLIAGDMRVDLSDIAGLADAGEPVAVDISLGAGSLRVEVPHDVPISVDARVVVGEMRVGNRIDAGTDLTYTVHERPEDGAVPLEVTIAVGAGELEIVRSEGGN